MRDRLAMVWVIGALVLSYLLGGFPTAIVAGKALRRIDIRDYGSHNAGATNVWRVLGAGPAITVLLVDAVKGIVAVLLVSRVAVSADTVSLATTQVLCGLSAIVGHIWTVFAGFKGGKGVGTTAGVFCALAPWAALVALASFVLVVALTRYISAGSITAAVVLASALIVERALFPGSIPLITVGIGLAVAVLVIARHRSNIRRLLNGRESKFGRPASSLPAPQASREGRP